MLACRFSPLTVFLVTVMLAGAIPSRSCQAAGTPDLPLFHRRTACLRRQMGSTLVPFFLPSMEAGEVDLQLAGETRIQGKKALKIVFNAHSSGTLGMMSGMKIEDEFVFLAEPETFCSLAFRKKSGKENANGRSMSSIFATRQLHIREMDESVVPPAQKKREQRQYPSMRSGSVFRALFFPDVAAAKWIHSGPDSANDDKIKEIRCMWKNRKL